MKTKILSKKILILPALLVVALLIALYIMFANIKSKSEHTAELTQQFSSQTSREQYALSLQKTIQDANSDIARINSTIIPSDGDVTFIEDMENMARADGLSVGIDSLSFDDTIASSTLITVFKINANTSGSWLGTYTFLAQLESLPYKIKINNFGFMSTSVTLDSNGKVISQPKSVWQSSFEILVLKYK